jgi:CheY-like chemotaxis protein
MTRPSDEPPTKTPREAGVLIVGESSTDAVLIKSLLKEDFDNVLVKVSAEANLAAAEFVELNPQVLMLAFREISKAEQCYLGLFRTHGAGTLQPHRTVLLCTKESVKQAFDLCRRGLFDDYVLFWPMTYDAPRLRMTVHRALAELGASPVSKLSAVTIAAQARRILELEVLLSQQLALGQEHIEAAGNAVARAEHNVRNNESVIPQLQSVSRSLQPLAEWAGELQQTVSAHRESGRALGALTAQMRPVVLIVEDDESAQSSLSLMLEPEGYELRFAASGFEALRQLSRASVDIILMDYELPDLDGIEVTKRLKNDPRLAAIPVIIITGNSGREVVLGCRKIGAAHIIVKPVERSVILDKLRRLCFAAESAVAQPQ